MSKKRERPVRTTITLPASLKAKIDREDESWSEVIREMLKQRIEEESEADMAEAVILNERVRRPAPKEVIKQWRRKPNS